MNLRNKTTGQIGNFVIVGDYFVCTDLITVPDIRTVAELNEEWESIK